MYVLRVVNTSNFKIGFSTNVEKRIAGWRKVIPFVELEPVSVYFTPQAKRLEAALHKYFSQYSLRNTEWFELPISKVSVFEQTTEQLLNMLGVAEIGSDEKSPYDHRPFITATTKTPEQAPQENQEPDKSRRLKRLPDYQELDNPPSIQEEFEFGLLPEMLELYDELLSWEAVGEHYGISEKIARNVAENEIMPLDNNNRRKFGLCMTYPDFEDGST